LQYDASQIKVSEVAVQIDKDLVAASSTPLVLAILSEGENYGYAILKRVRDVSDGEMEWTDGMLYPLLHRLNRLGYVTQEWRVSPEGRRRRYYAITDEGHRALAEHKRQWTAVARVLGGVFGDDDRVRFGQAAEPRRPATLTRVLSALSGASLLSPAWGRA
jgi:PadR family transcriptional regulator PadR